jgi:hypothetical protein
VTSGTEIEPVYARTLTDRIKVAVEGTWHLITEAYVTRAWAALGYPSWDDYCTREFGTSRLRLPSEDRREIVSSLREQGLSLRAISAATGVAVNTIRSDTDLLCQIDTVEPAPTVIEIDNVLTQEDGEAFADDDVGQVVNEPVTPLQIPTVTGVNGKVYAAKSTTATRTNRSALPKAFRNAVYKALRATEAVARLSEDDRFKKNTDQISQVNRHDLIRARDALTCVIDQL